MVLFYIILGDNLMAYYMIDLIFKGMPICLLFSIQVIKSCLISSIKDAHCFGKDFIYAFD